MIYDKAGTPIQPAIPLSQFKGFQHEMNGRSRLYTRCFCLALFAGLFVLLYSFHEEYHFPIFIPLVQAKFIHILAPWVAQKWSHAGQRITSFEHNNWLRNELLTESIESWGTITERVAYAHVFNPPLDFHRTWEHLASSYLKPSCHHMKPPGNQSIEVERPRVLMTLSF